MANTTTINFEELEKNLNYEFRNRSLALESLTHPSHESHSQGARSYERMEFLGDSVLALIVSDILFHKFPNEPEGDLAKRRSALVCWESLADVAKTLHLDRHLLLGHGEEINCGRENIANLENCFEAIIGAIFLDGGIEPATKFVTEIFEPLANLFKEPPKDPKTALQEWAQARGLPIPEYKTISETGPSHAPIFIIEVSVENNGNSRAEGSSKKAAAKEAALKLLEQLTRDNNNTNDSNNHDNIDKGTKHD